MRKTANKGIDLVLNSLSDDLLHLSWHCIAEFGKFIEIGKRDLLGRGQLDMEVFGLESCLHWGRPRPDVCSETWIDQKVRGVKKSRVSR